jgi:RNA polymerase sigma-70 factor (ECF subfamily)
MPPDPAPTTAAAPAPSGPSDDERLVAKVLERDRKAAAQFVSAHVDAVHAYVRRRLAPRRDAVDDLVQDVFVAALNRLHTYQGTSPLRAWLLGIARHKVGDHYRDRLRRPLSLDEEPFEPAADGPPPEDAIDRGEAAARARHVLGRLPEPYALVLLWRYWDGRSAREIAAATGRTEKAVERLLARARARFRTLWETR